MKASKIVASAYLCAVIVAAFILALITFAIVVTLPSRSGASAYITDLIRENPSLAFIALIIFTLFLVAPIYAAKWVYDGVLKLGLSFTNRTKDQKEE